MARELKPLISLMGSALFAVALGVGHAYASGSGSGGDDDFPDDATDISDNSGPSGGGDDYDEVDDSGDISGSASSDDRDYDDNDDDDDSHYDRDHDSRGSGSYRDDDDYSYSSDPGSYEASGGYDSGSGYGSGDSGSSDDYGSGDSGSNSGSSDDYGSNSGHGSDDSNSGSGSSDDSNSESGDSGAPSGSGADHSDEHTSHYAFIIDHDDRGREYVHGEVLVTGAARDVEAASEAGFTLISTTPLSSMDVELARMHIPDGMTLEQAVSALSAVAPGALVTPNSVYRHSQSFIAGGPLTPSRRARRIVGTLGIIDTGIHASALPAPSALLSQRSFAGPRPIARQHGSVVAVLAVQHGMRVHVADVFGQSADGALIASADSIAAALDWMIVSGIPVINVSIEGPNNSVLQELVRQAAQRGHVVVAAAGNGGPMARPAYPAAFEGAVAVTAIDDEGHPYMRANRGAYIAFAARGVDLEVATGDTNVTVSGTSFAAPIVAATIAAHMRVPSPAQAERALAALRESAEDLGAPGRDPIFGWGALRD